MKPSPSRRTVSLDLERVWFVDSRGVTLLRDLAQKQVSQTQLLSICKPATEGGDPMMTASTETSPAVWKRSTLHRRRALALRPVSRSRRRK